MVRSGSGAGFLLAVQERDLFGPDIENAATKVLGTGAAPRCAREPMNYSRQYLSGICGRDRRQIAIYLPALDRRGWCGGGDREDIGMS